jgi:BASS family bile acid:Na+ symporter
MKPWIMVRKGIRLNRFLEQRMMLMVLTGLAVGAVFHDQMVHLKTAVQYIFAYMTFAMAVNCSSNDFKKALKSPGHLLSILGLLHVALPLLATVLAKLFLPGEPLFQAGIVLITAAPIGVASSIWISLSGGDTALSLTAVTADTILSPLIVPLVMLLSMGQSVQFDVPQLMTGLALMVVLPTVLGMICHDLTKGEINRKIKFITGPTTKISLFLIVGINLAVAWGTLHLLRNAIWTLLALAGVMGFAGYLAGYGWGRITKQPPALVNTFIFSVGMRNITAGLVIALKYFPEQTALPVVFVIVFQQPLAALCQRFLAMKGVSAGSVFAK